MARTSLLALCMVAMMFAATHAATEAMADVQELDTQPKLGENATPEEVEKEQAEIDAAKKEAADLAAQPKDSLEEVVPSAKVHEAVKQTLVEEEKLYSLMSFNFRKGAEGKYAYADYYVAT